MRRPARAFVPLIVVAALLGLAATAPAAAQEPPATIDFRIAKFDCPTDPGNVSVAGGNIPQACDPAAGVTFTVAAPDGTVLATCVTAANGFCRVAVPNEADVVVTEDVSTATPGFLPRQNPIATRAVTEFAGALFINLPQVTTPPKTGVGAAPAALQGNTAALAAGLAGLAAVAAVMTRGRRHRAA